MPCSSQIVSELLHEVHTMEKCHFLKHKIHSQRFFLYFNEGGLKYFLKEPLSPKQPTNQLCFNTVATYPQLHYSPREHLFSFNNSFPIRTDMYMDCCSRMFILALGQNQYIFFCSLFFLIYPYFSSLFLFS